METYFTGKPCRRGHLSARRIWGDCIECQRITQARYYAGEKGKAALRRYAGSDKDKAGKKLPHRRAAANLRQARYVQTPKGRANLKARKSRVKQATPKWVSRKALREIYLACPAGWEVDHIVPIDGQDVCGLHVPWNLQYLPMPENRAKGNRITTASGAVAA